VVLVATCAGKIIGCMSAAVHPAYVSGMIERIAHVGDLKVHPLFTGKRLSLRLISALEARLRCEGIDLCFSLVAEGNHRVMPISEGKHGTPAVVHLGRFIVEQLLPQPFRRTSKQHPIEEATQADLPQIVAMLDAIYRHRQFAPHITAKELERSSTSAAFSKTLVVREAGRIVATLTVEDTQTLRQNVLMGLPGSLRVVLVALRLLAVPIPGFTIPRIGSPLTMLYVRHMACAEGREDALRSLIIEARVEAFRRRFTFLSVGLHERDPLRSAVKEMRGFTFHSLAMATSLITPGRVKGLVVEVSYEDYALV